MPQGNLAFARYLGILVGPAVGGAILLALGPAHGIMLNTIFYLPLVLWLVKAPYGPRFRAARRRRAGLCGDWPTSCTPCATSNSTP